MSQSRVDRWDSVVTSVCTHAETTRVHSSAQVKTVVNMTRIVIIHRFQTIMNVEHANRIEQASQRRGVDSEGNYVIKRSKR